MLIPPLNWGLVERGLSRSGLPTRINLPFLAKQKMKTIVYLVEEDEEDRTNIDQEILTFIADNNIHLIHLGGSGSSKDALASTSTVSTPSNSTSTALANGGVVSTNSKESTSKSSSASSASLQPSSSQGSNWKPTSEDLVIAALTLILDPRQYPLHIMCSSSGRHRTGVVVGCFRKLQHWALSAIFGEYRRYAGTSGGGRGGTSDMMNELMMNEQFIELFDIELVTNALMQRDRSVQKHLKQINVQISAMQQQQQQQQSLTKESDASKDGSLVSDRARKMSLNSLLTHPSHPSNRSYTSLPTPSAAHTPTATPTANSTTANTNAMTTPMMPNMTEAPPPMVVPTTK